MKARYLMTAALVAGCGGDDAPAADAGVDAVDAGPGCGASTEGTIAVAAPVTKLAADVRRCRVYGVAGDQLLVLDGRTKLLRAITLPSAARDLDLAEDGKLLVMSHPAARSITRLDPDTLEIVDELPTAASPVAVEVSTYGEVFYTIGDFTLRRVDLSTGVEVAAGLQRSEFGDIELSADDRLLFTGESASRSSILAYGIFDGAFGIVDLSGIGPVEAMGDNTDARIVLSPSGTLYYAQLAIDAGDLMQVGANFREPIVTSDAAGRIVIGRVHAFADGDPARARALAAPITAGAVLGDEAWLFEPGAMQLRYVAIDALR